MKENVFTKKYIEFTTQRGIIYKVIKYDDSFGIFKISKEGLYCNIIT